MSHSTIDPLATPELETIFPELEATLPELETIEYGGLIKGASKGTWSFRARRRLFWMVLTLLLIIPVQSLLKYARRPFWWPIAGASHSLMTRALGIDLKVTGKPHATGPVLFISNHISWLDILILGRVVPHASFVAKSEIAEWGFVGWLTGLQRTLFVNRARRHDSANQRDVLISALARGDSLILFPEGTSTLGQVIQPFKSSLLAVAEKASKQLGAAVPVQPVTLAFTGVDRIPLTCQRRSLVAWVGDMELVDHAREVLDTGSIQVHVHFHESMSVDDGLNRKTMTARAEQQIAAKLDRLNSHKDT